MVQDLRGLRMWNMCTVLDILVASTNGQNTLESTNQIRFAKNAIIEIMEYSEKIKYHEKFKTNC